MVDFLMRLLGYRVEYHCDWGIYERRFDAIDYACMRPIHRDMSVAPPWAVKRFVRG